MADAFTRFSHAVRDHAPRTAVVLGSGLGNLGADFREQAAIPFADVPGLCVPSVGGHSGKLVLATLAGHAGAGRSVLVFFGRIHGYEGRTTVEVTAPVRIAASLGARRLILTNAAGGIHPSLEPGALMALRGHLKLLDGEAWRAHSIVSPYSEPLLEQLRSAGLLAGIYAALTGPCYETPAEIRALRTMGADAVGMSTAREAEAAAELGLEVAAISCITNRAAGLGGETLHHAEVLANARLGAARLQTLLSELV
ncbi:MAG: purine-nucleoside phosphorylase [Gemmataceae bacterium]